MKPTWCALASGELLIILNIATHGLAPVALRFQE